MMNTAADSKFDLEIELPDKALEERTSRLVGFQKRFDKLNGHMRLIADQKGLENWVNKYHKANNAVQSVLGDRYPLVIFHGDVGTGKTVTAEGCANELARILDKSAFLLKMGTKVRGIGHVGEMSALISDAFSEAVSMAGKDRFVSLIIDEGDSLAFNRSAERAHHEDLVGVNTIIQQIDDIRRLRGRLLIFLCTNRFEALDPAIIRRASLIEHFERPSAEERRELFEVDLQGVEIPEGTLEKLVELTGPRNGRIGLTFSDIQTRLLPEAVRRAFPDRPLSADDLLIVAKELEPTPVLGKD